MLEYVPLISLLPVDLRETSAEEYRWSKLTRVERCLKTTNDFRYHSPLHQRVCLFTLGALVSSAGVFVMSRNASTKEAECCVTS